MANGRTHKTEIYEIPSVSLAENGFHLDIITKLFNAGKLDQRSMLWLGLAVQEAVTNSLEHGNLELKSEWKADIDRNGIDRFSKEKTRRLQDKKYANRLVKIQVVYDSQHLEIKIQDEGVGFMTIPIQPLVSDEIFGKGFTLIKAGVDQVQVLQDGRGVRLVKWF